MAQRTTSAAIFNHNIAAKIKSLQAKQTLTEQTLTEQQRLDLAQAWWQKGLIEGNVFHIDKALKILIQNSPQAYLLRSKLNMSLHRYQQAKENLEQLKLTHNNTDDKISKEAKQLHQQIDYLTGHVHQQIQEQTTATLSAHIQFLLANNQPKQAQSALEQAVAQFNDSHPVVAVALHLLSAQVAKALRQEALEFAHLNKALERMPNHAGALKAMANAHQRHKRYQQAISCLEQAKQTSPDPQLLSALAKNYHFIGQAQRAKQLDVQASSQYLAMQQQFPKSYHKSNHGEHSHHQHSHSDNNNQKHRH